MKNLQQNHSVERTGTSRPLISSSQASGGWLPPLTLVVRLTVPGVVSYVCLTPRLYSEIETKPRQAANLRW